MRAKWVLLLWQSCRLDWPLVWLTARPCFVQKLPGAFWWGWVTRQQTAEPQGTPGLVLDYWQAEQAHGVWLQSLGIPELVSDHWLVGGPFLTPLGTGSRVS